MIEFSFTEMVLLVSNIVSWALYFRADEKRRNAEFFARAMIQDKEIREKVVSEFEAFEKARERNT
jgi:hypothetical protein